MIKRYLFICLIFFLNNNAFGSIKENITLEKRVSVTPDSAKNIIGLGLKVCVEKHYAIHIGINDDEYKNIGVEIKNSANEVFNSSNLITKVNCP